MFLPSDYKGGRFLFNLIKCRKNRKKLSKKVFLRFFAYFYLWRKKTKEFCKAKMGKVRKIEGEL